jgi:hypothetical protein
LNTAVDRWGAAGLATRFGVISDANHFTAIAPLADPQSPMVLRLKELVTRQSRLRKSPGLLKFSPCADMF